MMTNIKSLISRLVREEEGATMVEYVLLIALIGVAAVAAMSYLSKKAGNAMGNAANKLP